METNWSDIKVGEIVKIDCDQEFPADILCFEAAKDKDIVYVDTMNLDGETNLKEKFLVSSNIPPKLP